MKFVFGNKRVVIMFPKFPLLYLLYSYLGDSSKEKQIQSNMLQWNFILSVNVILKTYIANYIRQH